MAIRKIILEGDDILRRRCREVREVDDHIRALLGDMADTLRAEENGAGLAACQVGILRRLVVIDMGGGLMKLVNPEIVQSEGEQDCLEGCLSLPGVWGRTRRPMRVRVRALGENGAPFEIAGEGALAKCLCHELDHLDGILFTDKVTEYADR